MAEEETSSTLTEGSSLPELYDPSKQIDPAKAMKSKVKPSHPSTADMVTEAIVQLAERGGSSLPAIKKFISNSWKLDIEKQGIYIRRYLRSAVANGSLIQTKGRGASGSFKLPPAKPKAAKEAKKAKDVAEQHEPAKKPVATKKTEPTKIDSAQTKKQASSKKVVKKASSTVVKKASSTVVKKAAAKKSPPSIMEPKSPSKTKKVAKSPTSKPKAPKPKKVTATKSAKVGSPKKVTAAKK